MHKVIGIIFIIILAACAAPPQTGTGGYDPEFQNLVAVATQTGAAVRIQQTETAKTATVQAMYAEQTAVSSYATQTTQAIIGATAYAQANETAVSATETAVYKPAALRQTEEAQTVLMQREALNTSATATAVKLQINKDADAAKRWGWFWTGVMLILGGLGVAAVFALLGFALSIWRRPDVFEDSNGHIVALDRRLVEAKNVRHVSRPVVIENQAPQIQAPVNNMVRPVTWKVNGTEQSIEVTTQAQISDHQWYTFAHAVLVKEIGFSREAITEETWLSQGAYNAMYAQMAAWGMVETGEGEPEKLNNARCYEYLFNRLSADEQARVRYPHPGGLSPVFEGVNQPNQLNQLKKPAVGEAKG